MFILTTEFMTGQILKSRPAKYTCTAKVLYFVDWSIYYRISICMTGIHRMCVVVLTEKYTLTLITPFFMYIYIHLHIHNSEQFDAYPLYMTQISIVKNVLMPLLYKYAKSLQLWWKCCMYSNKNFRLVLTLSVFIYSHIHQTLQTDQHNYILRHAKYVNTHTYIYIQIKTVYSSYSHFKRTISDGFGWQAFKLWH